MAKSKPTPEEVVLPVSPSIRAKFQCVSCQDLSTDEEYKERIHMHPVTGDNPDGTANENASFSKFTPSGVVELLITNPDTKGFFESGKQYYLDITDATPI